MRKSVALFLGALAVIAVLVGGFFWAHQSATPVDAFETENAQFVHADPEETIAAVAEKKEGIYYFGFPTCPWCKELSPVLNEVLKETGQKASVVNTRADNFTEELRSKLVTEFQKYQPGDLSVPFLVVIDKDGNVKSHVGTIEGHNAHIEVLNDEGKKVLKETLVNLLK